MKNQPAYVESDQFTFKDQDVSIDVIEIERVFGVVVKRMYFIETGKYSSVRGNHAHINQEQVLILLGGNAQLSLTNSIGNCTNWNLSKAPVFVPRNHWIELELDPSSKVLCLASEQYDRLVSVKNKEEFLA